MQDFSTQVSATALAVSSAALGYGIGKMEIFRGLSMRDGVRPVIFYGNGREISLYRCTDKAITMKNTIHLSLPGAQDILMTA